MTDSKMTLKRWYKGMTVPSVTSFNYKVFIASCVGLVNKIVEQKLEKTITVSFKNCPTAYADQELSSIVISKDFANGDFSAANGGTFTASEDIIPKILGVIVHEAAHFAYSPKDLKVYAGTLPKILGHEVNEALAMRLGNIVEDIYIEHEVTDQIPAIGWMLDSLNQALLGRVAYEESATRLMTQENKPETVEELTNLTFFLIFAKLHEPIEITPYVNKLYRLAWSAKEMHTLEERVALAAELYDRIVSKEFAEEHDNEEAEEAEDDAPMGDSEGAGGSSMTDKETPDKKEENGDDNESDDGDSDDNDDSDDGEESDGLDDNELTEAVESMPKESTINHGSEGTAPPTNPMSWDIKNINSLIERGIEELQEDEFWSGEAAFSMNQIHPNLADEGMEIDTRYAGLARIGRQRTTVNRPYGQDRRRGHNIRKLHRIATDGRIFAESIKMTQYKPMEVVILVDCSGSMNWHGLIRKAGKAAIGAAAGLKEAKCEVEVVGHTADVEGVALTLYRIKDWSDPISIASRRMKSLSHYRDHPLCQNRDHLAVTEVAKDFRASNAQRRRLLIVISDGEPAAFNGYCGSAARQATRQAVDEIRKQGIDVMSISITNEAMRANNEIYGKESNVCNEDPNVIEEIVRNLILS